MGWIVGGVVAVSVVMAIGVYVVTAGTAALPAPRSATMAAPAPDISSMTPRERADRLFERIMIAEERGIRDTVSLFIPMALRAYEMIGPLDVDARYHVGLIEGLQGNDGAVRAQIDSIRQAEPAHLLATMLEFTLHRLREDSAGIRATYETFLDGYDSEMSTGKPEYQAHRAAIDAFRLEAAQATTNRDGTASGPGTGR